MLYRVKTARVVTPPQPHQTRTVEKLLASGGVAAFHRVGSGKTLTSLLAQDATGLPTDVVAPAPLVANFEKEQAKHLDGPPPPTRLRSYERAVRDGGVDTSGLVVFDEAHRGRNAATATSRLLRQAQAAPRRLFLTATPVFNAPSDVAPILNAAAGEDRFPTDPRAFEDRYVARREVKPGALARLFGAEAGSYPVLKNRHDLVAKARGHVDVFRDAGGDFPSVEEREVRVPMSDAQHDVYRFHEGRLPFWTRFKVRSNLPLGKAESENLNKFLAGLRQSSNTPRPYVMGMDDAAEEKAAPKLRAIADRVAELRAKDPNYRGVVYSNYLEGGLTPLHRMLKARGVEGGLFHGGVPKGDRRRLVEAFNAGKLPVLMISSSGSEGLDLKGTKHIAVTEPHFNMPKIDQIVGRGVRYRSHAHLPEAERKVLVERYFSTKPESWLNRLGIGKPDTGVEQFIHDRAKEKALLGKQIMDALQEASDAGPVRREVPAAQRGGRKLT